MNDDIEDNDDTNPDDEVSDLESPDEDAVIDTESADDDNVGDLSVEINVEELVATLESGDDDEARAKREIREKIEKFHEARNDDLDGTYNFDLDEDL